MSEKKNKYPWIKSIFRKNKDEAPVEDVYAGPDYYEEKKRSIKRAPFTTVYAGPDYFMKKDNNESDSSEAEKENEPSEAENPAEEDTKPEEDIKPQDPVPPPDFYPPEPATMVTYAGPQMSGGFVKMVKICENCEKEMSYFDLICPECGYDPADKKFKIICKNCGKAIEKTCKFCTECGSRINEERHDTV